MHPITEDLIVNLAPTGMVPSRAQTPYVPLTPAEIAADVSACVGLGVSMVHLHARDADGVPTGDPAVYAEIIGGIRASHPDLVVVVTTSGRQFREIERRAAPLGLEGRVKPDMASLTLGSLNFVSGAALNDPATIDRLAAMMKERGIRPELEVFDLGMINYAKVLIDRGLIAPPFYFNLLLGNIAGAQVDLLQLAALIADLPPGSYWSLGGIGRYQAHANALGALLGHGVRTGIEDNLWLDPAKTRLARNADLVSRVVGQAAAVGRGIASAGQVRRMLGLGAAA